MQPLCSICGPIESTDLAGESPLSLTVCIQLETGEQDLGQVYMGSCVALLEPLQAVFPAFLPSSPSIPPPPLSSSLPLLPLVRCQAVPMPRIALQYSLSSFLDTGTA